MQFEELCIPIVRNLNQVEASISKICENLSSPQLKEILTYFFKIPGKRLRPTLSFLSAGLINPKLAQNDNDQLVQFAIGLELMHSASLIHDDVLDGDLFRRGQSTLNDIYGKKVAILAGDVVYSLAFSTLFNSLPSEFDQMIVELTEAMCAAEVIQAGNESPSRDNYFKIINGKTALFTSVSCAIAAVIAGGTKEQIHRLETYGLNLGLAYQIIDDCTDGDIGAQLNITAEDAEFYGAKAVEALEIFENSSFKTNLINLINYITQRSPKNETI